MKKMLLMVIAIVFIGCNSKNSNLLPVANNNKFMFVNLDGEIIINPQFKEASMFREGVALVQQSGDKKLWGFIDENGSYVINPTYQNATTFNSGLAWCVSANSAPTAIDKKGEIKFALKQANKVKVFSEGLSAFSVDSDKGEIWGFVDDKGNVVINPQFKRTLNFQEGKCAVMNENNEWGFIDDKGKLIINYQFRDVMKFQNGYAVVSNGEMSGVIDDKGKYVINPQFDKMFNDDRLFLISQGGKYGWCDESGKIIINPQFDKAYPFLSNELAPILMNNKWGFVNKEGKIVINPQFRSALPFFNGVSVVVSSNKIGLIDKEGTFKVNPQFEDVSSDYLKQITNSETEYNEVTSDYFDINLITSLINIDKPHQLSLQASFKDVIENTDIKETDLRYYKNSYIISREKNKYGGVELQVLGKPFNELQELNINTPVLGYEYKVYLRGKADDKIKSVISQVASKLNGYEKSGSETNQIYTGKNSIVKITNNNYYFSVLITPLKKEVEKQEVVEVTDNKQINKENIIGKWGGKFGKNTLELVISEINEDMIKGYNIVKNNRRNVKGNYTLYKDKNLIQATLKEPGDHKYDGVFEVKFDLKNNNASGSWKINKGTSKKVFDLIKK